MKVLIEVIKFFLLIIILLNLILFIIFTLFLMCLYILVLGDNLSFLIVVGFLILYSILLIVMVLLIFYRACLFLINLIIIIATFNHLADRFLLPIVICDKFLVNFRMLILFKFFVLILIDWIRWSEFFWCILILKIISELKAIWLCFFLFWTSLRLLFHPFLTIKLFKILFLIRLIFLISIYLWI